MWYDEQERNPYLQHEVESAGPARLRWMLIRRAEELCAMVEQLWQSDTPEAADQWLLRIREILGELLEGVSKGDDRLRKTISDLYVFMIGQVLQLEQSRNLRILSELRNLLAIECETWRLVLEQESALSQSSDQPADLNGLSEIQDCSSLSLDA